MADTWGAKVLWQEAGFVRPEPETWICQHRHRTPYAASECGMREVSRRRSFVNPHAADQYGGFPVFVEMTVLPRSKEQE
jgi:hypothetical protein